MNRSELMSKVRSENTSIEIKVRKCLFEMGYRFRLNSNDIYGKPDIILPKYNTLIFVHGCFWHKHNCKKGKTMPKTNVEFWENKLNNNKKRDKKVKKFLKKEGWNVLIVWECQTNKRETLMKIISKALPKK